MKKVILCFVCIVLLFSGCSASTDIPPETIPPILEPEADYVLVDNITFRRGEEADGEIMFTGDALEKVSAKFDTEITPYPQLLFIFTEDGKELLYKASSELCESGEKMSCWIGEDRMFAASFEMPLSEESMVAILSDHTLEQVVAYFYQFYGIG